MSEEITYALDDIKSAIRNDPPYTNQLVLSRQVPEFDCGWSLFRLGTNLSWNGNMPSGMYVFVFRVKDDSNYLVNIPLHTAVGIYGNDYDAVEWAISTGNSLIQDYANKTEKERIVKESTIKDIPF